MAATVCGKASVSRRYCVGIVSARRLHVRKVSGRDREGPGRCAGGWRAGAAVGASGPGCWRDGQVAGRWAGRGVGQAGDGTAGRGGSAVPAAGRNRPSSDRSVGRRYWREIVPSVRLRAGGHTGPGLTGKLVGDAVGLRSGGTFRERFGRRAVPLTRISGFWSGRGRGRGGATRTGRLGPTGGPWACGRVARVAPVGTVTSPSDGEVSVGRVAAGRKVVGAVGADDWSHGTVFGGQCDGGQVSKLSVGRRGAGVVRPRQALLGGRWSRRSGLTVGGVGLCSGTFLTPGGSAKQASDSACRWGALPPRAAGRKAVGTIRADGRSDMTVLGRGGDAGWVGQLAAGRRGGVGARHRRALQGRRRLEWSGLTVGRVSLCSGASVTPSRLAFWPSAGAAPLGQVRRRGRSGVGRGRDGRG